MANGNTRPKGLRIKRYSNCHGLRYNAFALYEWFDRKLNLPRRKSVPLIINKVIGWRSIPPHKLPKIADYYIHRSIRDRLRMRRVPARARFIKYL